ncbi:MAG: NAD(P)-dependent oxidoreductase [Candidatus Methylomirabilales bacterium]
MKILVTPAEACRAWDHVRLELGLEFAPILTHGQVEDPQQLAHLLSGVDAAILGLERVDASVLRSSSHLKVISRFGVGFDAIDLDELKGRGIRLTNTPGCMAYAVARQTIAFLLAITFNLFDHNRRLKEGSWVRMPNGSCSETTLGIVGMGAVGREVAELARPLGYRVASFGRSRSSYEGVDRSESLKDLIHQSDVVSLHVPLALETHELISGAVVGWLSGKSLINTSRGGLVSEEQILNALNEGLLRYYATDVFSVEPIRDVSKELARHERVICTPHVGAQDPVTARWMLRQAVSNAVNCLTGLHEVVNAYVL